MTIVDRAGYVAGLRALADWYEQNPAVPLSKWHTVEDMYFVERQDDEAGTAELHAIASALDLPVTDGRRAVLCGRTFGPRVSWSATYLLASRVAEHEALMSYSGAVQPEPVGAS